MWPVWSRHIQEAFEQLRDDRHYGAMGGIGRIWFSSISEYADRRRIEGEAFDAFLIYLRAIDAENIAIENERAKAERDKSKTS